MKSVSPAQLRRFNHARRPSILDPSKQRIAEKLVPLQVTAVVSCPCRRSLNSKVNIFDGLEMRATFSAIRATSKEIIFGGVVVTVTNVSKQRSYNSKRFYSVPGAKTMILPRKYVDAADARSHERTESADTCRHPCVILELLGAKQGEHCRELDRFHRDTYNIVVRGS
jgi:hypothetical protein